MPSKQSCGREGEKPSSETKRTVLKAISHSYDFTVKNEKTGLRSLWDVGIGFSRRAYNARTTEGKIKGLSVKT